MTKKLAELTPEELQYLEDNGVVSSEPSARIYVGTYNKYNQGSIDGEWVDLDDFGDYEDFMAYIAELHKDEEDPEFMFQDWEDIPDAFISESGLDPKYFDYKDAMEESGEPEAFEVFISKVYDVDQSTDWDEVLTSFQDSYQGQYDSEEDYTYNLIDDIGGVEALGEVYKDYIDEDMIIRDFKAEGYAAIDEEDAEDDPENYPEGAGLYFGDDYIGNYDGISEYVDELLEEGVFSDEQLANYFDYKGFTISLFSYDYEYWDGFVFNHNYL
jgi:antirestriction protein